MTPELKHFLQRATFRRSLAELSTQFAKTFIWICAAMIVLLACSRLLGVFSVTVSPTAGLIIPALALLLTLAIYRKPKAEEIARDLDARAGSKELFLTAISVDLSSDNFNELVSRQATEKAANLNLAALLPFPWLRPVLRCVGMGILVIAAALWLPQFDPFKQREKQIAASKQQERLEETKTASATRKVELAVNQGKTSQDVNQALAQLDKAFKATKPADRKLNDQLLTEQSKKFNELWKQIAPNLSKPTSDSAQKFGDAAGQKRIREMVEALKQGDSSALQKEIQKLQDRMKELAAQPDSAAKREQMQQLAKEMATTVNQLKQQVGSKELDKALARAMEQLDMSKLEGMGKEALDAANQSMQLSKEELERVGEMFKNAKATEDALKNLQSAKTLNEMGKLDGGQCKGSSMADYQALYERLLAQQAEDGEPGEGGRAGEKPGRAQGGTVGENDSVTSGFEPARSTTQIGAGKMLMEWKEKGIGEIGTKGAYQDAVRSVKQSVSEAIRSEKIPPGYHSNIQKYFDSLPESTDGAPK